ncbi:uncharacterized protein RMCC_2654 [Mycolicibacterium canariasense]|uniref:Uncharacterized protein n=1 Tax=Mycolicibacterium canariasense TaxID=228230 RepID=A0A117IA18_MYCCR|nr:hypothetical protein [Mycolicibacterium canariasense]MCV7212750.1 hypothetical protein [Mycolicibacterium canariasense]ORV09751.1 hypothetical protein AWB94_08575 [Mycolicibacterium canariasense]GAS95688.1 uncharacterized protein RMCC_2654 [Mycolicibacterium canariasense]
MTESTRSGYTKTAAQLDKTTEPAAVLADIFWRNAHQAGAPITSHKAESLAAAVLADLRAHDWRLVGPLAVPDMIGAVGSVWTASSEQRFDGPIGDVQYRPDTGHIEIRDDYERDYARDDVERDALVLLAAVAVGRSAAGDV